MSVPEEGDRLSKLLSGSQCLTRRQFLKLAVLGGGALLAWPWIPKRGLASILSSEPNASGHEALFFEKLSATEVRCTLCFRNCVIPLGQRGFCRARENDEGVLRSLTYGNPVAIHIDPIEKEPLFHFHPGSDTLCAGAATCNFECEFCINWEIALRAPEEVQAIPTTPEELVDLAIQEGIPTICFTYNEPTQHYEYVLDVMMLAKERGLRTTLHTNGGMNPEPLRKLIPYLDSAAVDLKAFDEAYYRDVVHAELSPVLQTIEPLAASDVWLEVVNLVIPTLNDEPESIRDLAQWVVEHLGPNVPVHFDRFFPSYHLTRLPPTPLSALERAHEIALESGVRFTYVGNVAGHRYAHTYCPNCSELLVRRELYFVSEVGMEDGHCAFCGEEIPGIWK